jgi:hypothetical protein
MDLHEFLDIYFPRPAGPIVPAKYKGPACGRPTRKKTPCQLPLMCTITTPWEALLREPPPHSCSYHLTVEEKEIATLVREALQKGRDRAHELPPACHTWDPPMPGQGMWEWQDERCAICGERRKARLLEDHCHETGLVRGGLCTACNIRDGLYPGGTFHQYRSRPPAVMVGNTNPYYFIVEREYAEPTAKAIKYLGPRPTDPVEAASYLARAAELPRHEYSEDGWAKNPLKGIGL